MGLTDLIETLISQTYVPNRDADGPFIFSVDHCFSIRGQGTIMTGTALNGSAAVNDVRHDFGLCIHVQCQLLHNHIIESLFLLYHDMPNH